MADGMFVMQRYYGSDDSPSESSDDEKSITRQEREKLKACDDIVNGDVVKSDVKLNSLNISLKSNSKLKNITPKARNEVSEEKHIDIASLANSTDLNSISNHDNRKGKKKKRLSDEAQLTSSSNKKIKTEDINHLSSNIDTAVDDGQNGENYFSIIGENKSQKLEKIKPNLPKWLSNPSVIGINLKDQEIPISELDYLDEFSKNNLREFGITFLFPVQLSVIPWLMQSNQYHPSDLCVSAPTGSGKTLAFVIPIVQSLKDRIVSAVRALVVLPVSELAIQVFKVFKAFIRGTDLNVVLVTGQKSFLTEQNALLRRGIRGTTCLADIVVTTPGRILDHINRTEGFSLQKLRYLVIDEADRMMDEIQKGWLKQIEDAVFKDSHSSGCVCSLVSGKRVKTSQTTACSFGYLNQPLQKLLYSATLSHNPEKLHSLSLCRPKLFITQNESPSEDWISKCSLPENLTLQHVICDVGSKPLVLCHIIKQRQFKKVLCFTESVERAQRLHLILEEMGLLRSKEISSNYRPVQRKIILEQFSSGKIDILVCSDLVARGIDIENVDCVVSYDVPLLIKTYIHRVGRTARAGKSGTAVALLSKDEFPNFRKLLSSAQMAIPSRIVISSEDLEKYVEVFQSALKVADSKFKKMKNNKKKRTKKTEKKKEKAS